MNVAVCERLIEGMTETFDHIPVMVREVEALLDLKAGATVVDCTLGLGGHSTAMTRILGPQGHLIALDQDAQAIEKARERLKGFEGRLDIVKSNFRKIDEVLGSLGVSEVDGVLFDLGVSSLQLDDAERGFSFRSEGPLDMRMDQDAPVSAFELVNSLSEEEIAGILWRYGEERFSRRIAAGIVRARSARPLETTKELADIVAKAMPYRFGHDGVHPATRSFQAIRIAVNQELDVLEQTLGTAFGHLKVGGRLCVISFHSLEDRIVKDRFRELAQKGCAALLTKKPLRPADDEAQANPRSRSARVRAVERIA